MAESDRRSDTALQEKSRPKVQEPTLYKVLLHNDDYTTQEFVIHILESVFDKSPADAFRIMMSVHLGGIGVCGTYTHEVAETKVSMVQDMAKERDFPLRASMEEA